MFLLNLKVNVTSNSDDNPVIQMVQLPLKCIYFDD
jgi:hypothetical protein